MEQGTQHVQLLGARFASHRPGSETRVRARVAAGQRGTLTARLVAVHSVADILGLTMLPASPQHRSFLPAQAQVLAEAALPVEGCEPALVQLRCWELAHAPGGERMHAQLTLSTGKRMAMDGATQRGWRELPAAYAPIGVHRGAWSGARGGTTLGEQGPDDGFLVLREGTAMPLYYDSWFRAPVRDHRDAALTTPVRWRGRRVSIGGRWYEPEDSPLLSWVLVVSFEADGTHP